MANHGRNGLSSNLKALSIHSYCGKQEFEITKVYNIFQLVSLLSLSLQKIIGITSAKNNVYFKARKYPS